MTDNEKAAIAAGLWNGDTRPLHDWRACGGHTADCREDAPDMHDPANLWRALAWLRNYGWTITFGFARMTMAHPDFIKRVDADTLFDALVALYNAEHPNEIGLAGNK